MAAREGPLLRLRRIAALLVLLAGLSSRTSSADVVPVRYPEGLVHGFLVLRILDGRSLADGDLIQVVRGDQVTSRLVLRFHDGSLSDETAVFSQRGEFRLISDRLVQKGPAFQKPMEVFVDARSGEVTVHYTEDGKAKTVAEHLELPADVANGMVLTLIKNLKPDTPQTTVSMVAATPKPRLVKLVITPAGEDPFSLGGSRRRATHFVVKIEIGGIAGLLAPLLGKQPQDTHVWILETDAPAFVRSEGPLSRGGPSRRLELVSPVWPVVEATPH